MSRAKTRTETLETDALSSTLPACGFVKRTEGLELRFDGKSDSDFLTWRWLRDHGTDEHSLDPLTLQRKVNTFDLPDDLNAREVSLDTHSRELILRWSDGVETRIDIDLILAVLGHTPGRQALASTARTLWDAERPLDQLPGIEHDWIMRGDEGVNAWVQRLYRFGFCLVSNVPASDRATEALAGQLGAPLETLFGRFWHLSADLQDHGDSAYTTEYLDPHTDGTYYHDAPGLQLFNCQQFEGKGGESVQVDGFALADRLKKEHPDAYDTLTRIQVPGHYIEPGHHVCASRPVLKLDAAGHLEQVSFNNYDRAPFVLSREDERAFYHAYSLFHRYACDQRHWVKIPLRPGTALIFDNWRNLHGRMGYVGKRVMYGCYHSRATFESKARILRQITEESTP